MEKLDVEYLQKLTYDRSKSWSSYFESYENDKGLEMLEDMQEYVDVSKIDAIFSSADDEDLSDSLLSMEDDEYNDSVKTEFLKNASNTSQFSLLFGNKIADLSLTTKNEDEKQYVDLINKTLPILNEHERQLQEFGFDKVLNSFKKDEIEDKFGRWLNRHNSLFGGDNTLISNNKNSNREAGKEMVFRCQKPTRGKICSKENKEVDSDSDASLQSGETARYIRSSRVGTVKNSTTTMIKTYRTVRKTRDALREKYACETDEDDYHQNALRWRNKLASIEHPNTYSTPCGRSRKHGRPEFSSRTRRRKVLRKRINDNGCNLDYSSSDSELYENYRKTRTRDLKCSCSRRCHCAANFCNTPLNAANRNGKILKARSAMKMSSAFRNRFYYFSRSGFSPTSSSTSFNSEVENRRAIKRNAKFNDDERPHKRESECCCFHGKELCGNFKHVADTSTEEWYVDNGYTPKKQLKTPMTKTRTTSSNWRQNENVTFTFSEKKQSNKYNLKENVEKDTGSKKPIKTPMTKTKAPSMKTNRQKQDNLKENNVKVASPDTEELKMAIKASKLTYKDEMKKLKKDLTPQKNDKLKPTKLKRTLKKIDENVAEDMSVIINNMASQKADKNSNAMEELTSKTVKKSTDETFFAPTQSQQICNSTALSCKGKAFKRQFADRQQPQIVADDVNDTENLNDNTVINLKAKCTEKKFTSSKNSKEKNSHIKNAATSLAVTSTTLQSPELTLTLSQQAENTKEMTKINGKVCDELSDCCADVSSTTNLEFPITKTTNQESGKRPLLNQNDEMTRNCLLIYSPEIRHKIAANCFNVDGYFTVTQQHLSNIIGEKFATKLLKFIACKRFRLDSTVYYKPPSSSFLINNLSTSSESADDLEGFGEYGSLISINKQK